MVDEKESPAFMSALVTEHLALQTVASSTIGESGNRAAIYLSALSSGLVAMGFASSSPGHWRRWPSASSRRCSSWDTSPSCG